MLEHGSLAPSSLALSCVTLLACSQVFWVFNRLCNTSLTLESWLFRCSTQKIGKDPTSLQWPLPLMRYQTCIALHYQHINHDWSNHDIIVPVLMYGSLPFVFRTHQDSRAVLQPLRCLKMGRVRCLRITNIALEISTEFQVPIRTEYISGRLLPPLHSTVGKVETLPWKCSSDTTKHSRFDSRPLLCWLMMGREQSASPAKWQATCNIIIVVVVSNNKDVPIFSLQKLEHVAMFHFQALTNKFFEYSAVIRFASPM